MPGQPNYDNLSTADKMAVDRVYSNFGKAIEAYERKLLDKDSKFDKYMAGDMDAMSEAAIRGAMLFVDKSKCDDCHSGGNFTDGQFHNIGVPQLGSKVPATDRA
jgi:cytochrome c peroxidase